MTTFLAWFGVIAVIVLAIAGTYVVHWHDRQQARRERERRQR